MEMSCCDNRLYSLVSTVEKKKKKDPYELFEYC